MNWPLIERELRRALRLQNLQQVRTWGTVGCAALACIFLLVGSGSSRGQGWGREFNSLLFLGGLMLIAQVPKYTVGIFAEERRNQTLGLLFLCGIGPLQLFASKTLGAALVSFSRLLLLYPFLALAFLGGGLSWQMFVATTCSLPLLLAYVFAVCVFASVLCREESTAMLVAVLVGAGIAVAPFAMNWLLGSAQVLLVSPAYAPYLAANRLSAATLQDFGRAALFSVGWTLTLLVAAAAVLSRVWQDQPDRFTAINWRTRLAKRVRGNAAWRQRLAARWLAINPYLWLALRDRWPVTLAGAVVTGGLVGWLLACVGWPRVWLSPAGMFVVVIGLNFALGWLVKFAAAKTIGDARRSGALELLLTTPMSHLDFVRGQLQALREQFRPAVRGLLVAGGMMVVAGLLSRRWELSSLVLYLLIWAVLLFWTASLAYGGQRGALILFWDALVCGRPAFVVLRQTGFNNQVWSWFYVFIMGGQLVRALMGPGFRRYPTGSTGEYWFLILVLVVSFVIWRNNLKRLRAVEDRLAVRFRYIAAVPAPEPSDPRYKDWKSGEAFPDTLTDYLVGRVLQQMQNERSRPGPRR
jgi:hypothetical protein